MILLNTKILITDHRFVEIEATTKTLDSHSILNKVNPTTGKLYCDELSDCLLNATLTFFRDSGLTPDTRRGIMSHTR